MNINVLLERFRAIGIEVIEQEPGRKFILQCTLPFPHQRQHAWYSLVLDEGQTEVNKHEIYAILRHLWHFSTEPDFFPDDTDD